MIKRRWYAGKGKGITAKLCGKCARELDEIYVAEYMAARKEKDRVMRKVERVLDKTAKEKWDEAKANIRR